ncbi:AAA family ATPase [Microbacterium sp. QXD-8]|uniref:AAA family ATPase n=1 Tax=Microbacterium psychrotolerans TaxID=3068321 RepID=A0ABU0YZU0_9MICO|nr:AAA family ATPase [Microbacterium sp. QXD-8]MDQ7877305.1 AAA family ATPase [Microbacterium sp. QXD-8]
MPRLDPEIVALLLPTANAALTAALEWADRGWPVFPLAPRDKLPVIPSAHPKGDPLRGKCAGQCGELGHGVNDASRDPDKIRRMFDRHPTAGIGGATTGRLVIDLDLQAGGRQVEQLPPTRTHLTGRANGNTHRIYRLGSSTLAHAVKSGHIVPGVDIKTGSGSYICLPPTRHPATGLRYSLLDDQSEHALTDQDVRAVWRAYGRPLPGEQQERKTPDAGSPSPSRDTTSSGGAFGHSEAVQVLLSPPRRGTGETNVALSKVAGFYARLFRDNREMYDHHVRQWLADVDPDYEDRDKTADSIWESERSKEGERAWAVAQSVERKLVEHEAKILFGKTLAELDPADPFDFGTLEEILARPEQAQFRVEGLVLADGFTSVVAQRKTGKTTFNLNLADSFLTGRDFLGRFPVVPVSGNVAILNYEVSGYQLGMWAESVGLDRKRLLLVNLRGRRNPLVHEQDRAALADLLRSRDVESLFIDPFSRAFYGESQQDNTQVQAFLNDLDVFARSEVGARDVILNVHAGWNGSRSRGASALEDHPDSIILLRKDGDEDDESGLRYMKALGRDVDVTEDQLHFDPESHRLSLTGLGGLAKRRKEQKSTNLGGPILTAVKEDPGANTTQIEQRLRGTGVTFQKGDVNAALQAMGEAGTIRREKGRYGAFLHYPASEALDLSATSGEGSGDDF